MIKKIRFYIFLRILYSNYLLIKFNYRNFILDDLELNFQNISFENTSFLKKIFISAKYINKKEFEKENYYYHSFDWLISAKKIGGTESINLSKKTILNWHKFKFSIFSFAWSNEVASKRLLNLLYFYDLYAQNLTHVEKKIISTLLYKHYQIIKLALAYENEKDISLNVTKAALLIFFIKTKSVLKITSKILKQLRSFIDENGYHKSYNPSLQAEFINDLYEIQNIYLYFKKDVPKEISFHIYNMTCALTNLFHKDHSIALFNGANNSNNDLIQKIINQAENIKIKENININNGIAYYIDKNKKLFFDVVKPSSKLLNQNLHAGTLSFELSCDKEKIITNCGSVEKRIGKKPEYLRFSAAHSTIILNNTNISELIEKSSYRRAPEKVLFSKKDSNDLTIMECSHDGYLKNFGIIVKRILKIYKNHDEISGQDSILSIKSINNKIIFDIRFHLMPECKCLLTNNKKSVLIKTNNSSWTFSANSELKIEDSIYVGDGKKIQQNKQIVLTKYLKNIKHSEGWSLKKI